jgi:hypothetical protein
VEVAVSRPEHKSFGRERVCIMESIVFGLIGLLSRLVTPSPSLSASVGEFFAGQFSRLAKLVETAIGVILWCVPAVFWTIMIRFVVKHW